MPGNNAFPTISSPRMHPIDHISTAFVYLVDPNNISGARYQRVATYSVITGILQSSYYATDLYYIIIVDKLTLLIQNRLI